MDDKELQQRVMDGLCEIAFAPATGTALGHKVRCLEVLVKILGLYDGVKSDAPVTIVEDI